MDVRTSDGTFDRCESAKDSAYLGSFTVLPETEDGREHRQLIQVMVDVDGNDPELCSDIDENGKRVDLPRNCIVLRRHVRFVEHEGFRIPMYLDDRCLGVSCEEDSTCFRGGCVDAKAPCDLAAGTCVPEAQRALGPNGAGFDPSKRALPPGVSAIDDAGNVTYEDGAVVEGGALPDGALAPTEDGAVTDATTDSSAPADAGASTDAADAGSVGDTPVASCSLCGARQCCSAAGKPPLFCRTTCNVGETECVRSDASNAINCEAPPPPPF